MLPTMPVVGADTADGLHPVPQDTHRASFQGLVAQAQSPLFYQGPGTLLCLAMCPPYHCGLGEKGPP